MIPNHDDILCLPSSTIINAPSDITINIKLAVDVSSPVRCHSPFMIVKKEGYRLSRI